MQKKFNRFMKNRKILVFRLTTTGYEGTPKSKKCPILSPNEKDEIKKYWDKVDVIDDDYEEYDKSDLIKELLNNGKKFIQKLKNLLKLIIFKLVLLQRFASVIASANLFFSEEVEGSLLNDSGGNFTGSA